MVRVLQDRRFISSGAIYRLVVNSADALLRRPLGEFIRAAQRPNLGAAISTSCAGEKTANQLDYGEETVTL